MDFRVLWITIRVLKSSKKCHNFIDLEKRFPYFEKAHLKKLNGLISTYF